MARRHYRMAASKAGAAGGPEVAPRRLAAAEGIIALIFPVAALVVVGDFHRDHVFRVLEAELGRHADLHGVAIGARQDVVAELERHDRLRMQRAAHVERRVVAVLVGTLEPAIFGAGVGPDQLEEMTERRSGPAADRAPAFDANMPRDLLLLRQLVEFLQRPGLLVLDEP